MAFKNQMKVKGKDINKPNADLTINLADDDLEVRGFGKPITRPKAKEMAEAYFKDIEAAETIIQEIDSNPAYIDLKNKAEFNQLKTLIDPSSQTVSGVFGKEIILQILSMRNCEGIRYIIGKDEGKNTVILIGVQEDGTQTDPKGNVVKALSAPVQLKTTATPQDRPIDAEVHRASLNIADARTALALNTNNVIESLTDIVFGTY